MTKQWWLAVAAWRIWLVVVVAVGLAILKFRPDFAFASFSYHAPATADKLPELITVWANFDGVLYLKAASQSLIAEPRFLPLYPLLIKVTSLTFWSHTITPWHVVASLVVTHVALAVALTYLMKLFKLDFSEVVFKWLVIVLLAFPTSFFLVSIYSESLFLAVAVVSFWFARQRQWWFSFGLVGLAGVLRLPGILLLLPIGWEWLVAHKKEWQTPRKLLDWRSLSYLVLALLPILVLIWVHAENSGDALKFVHAHGELANNRSTTSLVFPLITVWRYIKILGTLPFSVFEWWVALLELASVGLVSWVVYWSWKMKLRLSYQLYTLVMVVLPMLSGTFSGLPRYVLILFPMYLVVGHQLEMMRPAVRWGVVAILLVLQIVLLLCFARGYYVA